MTTRLKAVTPKVNPKFSISPSAEMLAAIERIAKEDHCSLASVIYRGIDMYVASRSVEKN